MLPTITQLVKGEPEFDSHVSDSEAFWTSVLSCFPQWHWGQLAVRKEPQEIQGPSPTLQQRRVNGNLGI